MSYQYLKYNPENNRKYMEIIYLTKYLYPVKTVKGLISRIILMSLEFSFYRIRSVITVKHYENT